MEIKVPYVSMKNIKKVFGKVVANKNVNLTVEGGEIHALLGENGAGKSTLMNMLSGVYTPDGGEILIHGREVSFSSPKEAIESKIGMIYQHFKLVDNMSAIENIMLGQKHKLFLNKTQVKKRVDEICSRYGLEIEIDKNVYDMSVGERQTLEILKVLYRGADILILDEPTTVFTPQEAKKLFKIMNRMKENGCAVIFITHKMEEVMEVSDRITVLRKGETIKTVDKKNTSPEELAELMVGHSVDLSIERKEPLNSKVVLEVKDLSVLNEDNLEALSNINFNLKSGEILGIAGIANSGQRELCEAIAGIYPIQNGEVILEGENIAGRNPRDIIKKGISMSFVPEDRLGMGLVGSMDMVENLLLKSYHNQNGFFIDKKPAIEKAKEITKKLKVQTPDIFYPIKNLSGGNIQKILLGRELDSNPHVLIMAYPVRGLDINTCYTIYDLMNEQKEKGVGVLFIGEDLDVLIQLCDRIMVMYNGKITGIVDAKGITKEKLGLLMVGKNNEVEGNKVV
ncbi:MAG: ABC transporter ATP-binding protein [Solirubrobacterales bacterium]